ncbi:MAG: uncharacterized protein QOD66_2454 [Solirubrobacteraceae bacterium]|nr:uncharacterized protein [Solirubrobacteraceae bacterium]
MRAGAERAHSLTTSDGVVLQARLAAPTHPSGVLVLCHGLSTDCDEHGAFPALRDLALRSGLAVVRFDFRAHGQSSGANADLRLAGLRRDVDAVSELIDDQLGGELPVVPVGVSFGGAAAVHLADTRPSCAGLVLWYAVIDYGRNFGPDSSVAFTAQMRAAVSEADPEWSAMPVLGTRYHLPAGLIEELANDPTPARLSALPLPVLAYYGSRDPLVDVEPVQRLAAERDDVELRIAHGASHGFVLWRPWVLRQTVRWAARAVRGELSRSP